MFICFVSIKTNPFPKLLCDSTFIYFRHDETESDLETVQNSWTPATLSAADLSSSLKNVIVDEPTKSDPVLIKRTSIPSTE